MRKFLMITVLSLFPMIGFTQTEPATETSTHGINISRVLWISAGVVSGVVIADYLLGGYLTTPTFSMLHPAVTQARSAGAVIGELIGAATHSRDAQARTAFAYASLVGAGAILGGWLANQFISNSAPEVP